MREPVTIQGIRPTKAFAPHRLAAGVSQTPPAEGERVCASGSVTSRRVRPSGRGTGGWFSVQWRKSSYSSGPGGECVEAVGKLPGITPVRDSKNSDGPALMFATPHGTPASGPSNFSGTGPLRAPRNSWVSRPGLTSSRGRTCDRAFWQGRSSAPSPSSASLPGAWRLRAAASRRPSRSRSRPRVPGRSPRSRRTTLA
ncbi:DUF397 domain-containing protein [Streptomyces coeruleorubidus]